MPTEKTPEARRRYYVAFRDKMRRFIEDCKNRPCRDCGIIYPHYVMDFDHVRGSKDFNLSSAGFVRISLDRVALELMKCEVVCSNCHRKRTQSRRPPTPTSFSKPTH